MTGRVVHGSQVPGVCHAEELHFLFRWIFIETLHSSFNPHQTTFQPNAVGDAKHIAK